MNLKLSFFAFSTALTAYLIPNIFVVSATHSDSDADHEDSRQLRRSTADAKFIASTFLDTSVSTANENPRLLRRADKKMRLLVESKAIPAFNSSKSPCKDSPLEILLQTTGGSDIPLKCNSLLKRNNAHTWCSKNGVLASHCPKVCGKCPLYRCFDSQGTFLMKNGCDRDCSWLQGTSARRKEIECKKSSVAETCRATCNFCATDDTESNQPSISLSGVPSAVPSVLSLAPSPVPSTSPSSIDWQQVHLRMAGDEHVGRFGYAIAMSSDGMRIVVGAYGHASDRGKVTVFHDNGMSWVPVHDIILGDGAGEQMGWSVGISANGKWVIAGAPYKSTNNGSNSGQISVFQDDGISSWVKVNSSISGKATNDRYGWAVGMSDDGSRIVVGAISSDVGGSQSGEVAVYQDDQARSTWVLVNAMIPGKTVGDNFGRSVGISADGSRVIAGAIYSDAGGNGSGEVAVYEDNGVDSSWVLVHNKRIPGKAANDQLGVSVDISSDGSRIVAGARFHDSNGLYNNGEVTVYHDDGSDWMPVHGSIFGLASGDRFGVSVKLSADGKRVVVGAEYSDAGGTSSGQVRVFDDNMSEWEQVADGDLNGTSNDYFGRAVGMSDSGKRIVVGAPSTGSKPGEVRVFER